MRSGIRFYFDNHMPKAVATELAKRGIDVLTSDRAGRSRLTDLELIRLSQAEGRVLVTQDQDFLNIAAEFQKSGEEFPGVVFCDHLKYLGRNGILIRDLWILQGVLSGDDMMNHVEYL